MFLLKYISTDSKYARAKSVINCPFVLRENDYICICHLKQSVALMKFIITEFFEFGSVIKFIVLRVLLEG